MKGTKEGRGERKRFRGFNTENDNRIIGLRLWNKNGFPFSKVLGAEPRILCMLGKAFYQ